MGAKHPLPKEAEPVEYFSQLSAESLFDMVLMDVLHACQFLDIIHLCLKHDFWQVKTFIFSFLTKKM